MYEISRCIFDYKKRVRVWAIASASVVEIANCMTLEQGCDSNNRLEMGRVSTKNKAHRTHLATNDKLQDGIGLHNLVFKSSLLLLTLYGTKSERAAAKRAFHTTVTSQQVEL